MKEPTPKSTRGPERASAEHLNSPVTDPGYWPYEKLAGGLQETITGVDEPADPMEFVPLHRSTKKESEDR